MKRTDAFARTEADRCVACGLCLPHCPTYRLTRHEAESPRGRIALMRALAQGAVPRTAALERHLARCLVCRACEAVCPSGVPYGRLIDGARAALESKARRTSRLHRAALDALISRPARLRRLARALRLYQASGLQRLARASGLLRAVGLAEVEAELPKIPAPRSWDGSYAPNGAERGVVQLFTGCIAALLEPHVIEAAIRVLNRLGYRVDVPPGQTCCGALHRHAGLADAADALMQRNLAAFGDTEAPILATASGCAATLSEYGLYAPGDEAAQRFGARLRDATDFVAHAGSNRLQPAALAKRVAVHEPCTLRNVLRAQDGVNRLLARIPKIDVQPLPGNALCCGAAGTYHIEHPDAAAKLRAEKLAHLERLAPDLLVTSNIGCALYLAAGLRAAGLAIEVTHPLELLDRQIGGSEVS